MLSAVLAWGVSENVGVAGIGALALIVVAIIQNRGLKTKANEAVDAAKLAAWGSAVQGEKVLAAVHDNVGVPNGKGNVVEILERLDERSAATHLLLVEHLKNHEHQRYVDPPRHVTPPGRVRPLSEELEIEVDPLGLARGET
jgi:hypothetical protein